MSWKLVGLVIKDRYIIHPWVQPLKQCTWNLVDGASVDWTELFVYL